jgi:regulator of PEP synthase PpsR (kinase-PPPase family)
MGPHTARNGELAPPIYIVSGGVGSSAEQVVSTVLVQFPQVQVPIIKVPLVRRRAAVAKTVARAAGSGGLIVHTLVDPKLRMELLQRSAEAGVPAVDLMGDLLQALASMLNQEPLAKPGLYRQLHADYFRRVQAIEFAIEHDDGQGLATLADAELVLIGVSRAGKTPLSMYLAMQGWLVANVPLVPRVAPPVQLDAVDRRRIIGLMIEAEALRQHRQKRHAETGLIGGTAYIDPARIFDETEIARKEFRRRRLATIDVTAKPIESSAFEAISMLTSRLGDAARR